MSDQEKDKKYRDKYEKYRIFSKQKSEIEDSMNSIKEEVAQMLHEDKMNEKIIKLQDGEEWKATYQSKTTTTTDLKALMEMLGPQRYGEVVGEKISTFLVIKKAGKKKRDDSLTSSKPVDEKYNMNIPTGTILS